MLKSFLKQFISHAQPSSSVRIKTKDDLFTMTELGFQSMHRGEMEVAIGYFEAVIREQPERWDVIEALGICYRNIKRYHYALSCYQRLEEIDETKYLAIVIQADILREAKRYNEAYELLDRAYATAPNDITLCIKLGEIHFLLGNYIEAQQWYTRCSEHGDSYVAILTGFGLVLRELGELDRAYHQLTRADELSPDNPDILMNLALVLHDQGNHDQALAYFRRVLAIEPDNSLVTTYQAFTLLEQGHLGIGWDAYEARWHHPDIGMSSFPFDRWSGPSESCQSLLIHSEQGIGDQIMFASCLPDLRTIPSKVVIECNDKLESLFVRSFPWATVIGRSKLDSNLWKKITKKITHKVAIGSLPRFFRRNYEDFPNHQGYLKADSKRSAKWSHRFKQLNSLVIGISWRGGLPGTRRHLRSLNFVDLERILSIKNCYFVNLQYDFTEAESQTIPASIRTRMLTDYDALRNLDETAAVISAVDLVVTVQTTVAHLSGALNIPTWILLPAIPEWRYRQSGSTLPWYPSVRLLRQTTIGDWSQVLDQLYTELTSGHSSDIKHTALSAP